jgi:carbamoyltransferase
MFTLGINAAYHDSAACLVENGQVVAAAEEERFTGIKHGKRPVPFSAYELPYHAIDFCLSAAGTTLEQVGHVAYSFNPFLLLGRRTDQTMIELPLEPSLQAQAILSKWQSPWDPLFLSYIVNAPRQLADGAPHHLKKRFAGARHDGPYRWHFVDHHIAHAASAYYASPFDSAAVLTLDGRGELATTSYMRGEGNQLLPLGEVHMPHSLGLLYEQVTTWLGFLHSSDEYKVMALASYGRPAYADRFRSLIRLTGDGRYEIPQFDLEQLFGPPRTKDSRFEERHFDIARSLQLVLEETVLALTQWLKNATNDDNLCMAGGVALNCVLNAKIRDQGLFRNVWVQPAAGDSGTALGAALWVDKKEREGTAGKNYVMEHAFLGPGYTDDGIEQFLQWSKLPYRRMNNIPEETAELLLRGRVIGWFQGRMEFGPRALGARSIIASPLKADMQARLNEIKDREDFRPVAPVVLEEEAGNWFTPAGVSPFMLFVSNVLQDKADLIPAVRHVDGTARIQTINRRQNERYYDLVKTFGQRTGVPVLINTSFNTRGKPIVCSPRDAVECFWTSPLDALVIGSFILEKEEQQHGSI